MNFRDKAKNRQFTGSEFKQQNSRAEDKSVKDKNSKL